MIEILRPRPARKIMLTGERNYYPVALHTEGFPILETIPALRPGRLRMEANPGEQQEKTMSLSTDAIVIKLLKPSA